VGQMFLESTDHGRKTDADNNDKYHKHESRV